MRPIDADHLIAEINELMKSPWFNKGKEVDKNAIVDVKHYGYIERKEAIETIVDLCINKEKDTRRTAGARQGLPMRSRKEYRLQENRLLRKRRTLQINIKPRVCKGGLTWQR